MNGIPRSRSRSSRLCTRRPTGSRSEEHTSELQSHSDLVCRLLLEKKKIVTPKPERWRLSSAPPVSYRGPNELPVRRPLVVCQVALENALQDRLRLICSSDEDGNLA